MAGYRRFKADGMKGIQIFIEILEISDWINSVNI